MTRSELLDVIDLLKGEMKRLAADAQRPQPAEPVATPRSDFEFLAEMAAQEESTLSRRDLDSAVEALRREISLVAGASSEVLRLPGELKLELSERVSRHELAFQGELKSLREEISLVAGASSEVLRLPGELKSLQEDVGGELKSLREDVGALRAAEPGARELALQGELKSLQEDVGALRAAKPVAPADGLGMSVAALEEQSAATSAKVQELVQEVAHLALAAGRREPQPAGPAQPEAAPAEAPDGALAVLGDELRCQVAAVWCALAELADIVGLDGARFVQVAEGGGPGDQEATSHRRSLATAEQEKLAHLSARIEQLQLQVTQLAGLRRGEAASSEVLGSDGEAWESIFSLASASQLVRASSGDGQAACPSPARQAGEGRTGAVEQSPTRAA